VTRAPADPERRKAPWTIPLADGPVAAWFDRTVAAALAGTTAVLVVALLSIDPDARGLGTHEKGGWEPCGWPKAYGMPCPTCGVTTAACHTVHGQLIDAFVVQPFGALAMLAMLALAGHACWCLLRGRSFVDLLVRLPFWRLVLAGFVVLLLAWGYKCLVFER
jgi:hypothetical protein